MTAFRKYFNLILVTAVFAALLMLFKFGVVEPAYTLKPGNPPTYGEMFGPVSCLKNWVYGGLILAWVITLFIASRKKTPATAENQFWGEKARYWFLYPTPAALDEISSLLKNLPLCDDIPNIDHPDNPQTLSLDETTRKISEWMWASYADELLDLKAGEESCFAGYFIFVDNNVLSVQICYMTEFLGGAVLFGIDAVRCDTDVFKVWIPDIDHSSEEIAAELQAIKSAISNGNWQDPCCDLKEQLTAWATQKNILLDNTKNRSDQ